ncbi:MAG: ABC transporter substrate-binding protein [Kiritimatiellia bacterium]|nr:extracellular solute-binding protein [Lentisphaerota bacterium]
MSSNHNRTALILALTMLAVLLAVPFLLRPRRPPAAANSLRLVIISPHNEAVRYEFATAFSAWHAAHFGRPVVIEWRNIGGTSEIARYLDSEFKAARQVGLEGIGIDLLFGGGQFDHARQARNGNTQPSAIRRRRPEWFDPEIIPAEFGGELFYDQADHWFGCCLSSFGICYNTDVIDTLAIAPTPAHWSDLSDFAYFGQLALADPTKSGSINKAFEMLIQEQMAAELGTGPEDQDSLAAGWRRALRLLRAIGANARYFTDAAGKVPMDVSQGNAAAGMCIDFYGRFESETVMRNEGSQRMRYLTPAAGSSISVDPISLLRGAPHHDLAEVFIEFCLSPQGQQLWNYRPGTAGGPRRYSLRRLPVRRDQYTPEHLQYMADPEALPYEEAAGFRYRPEWTARYFGLIRVLIRAMCLDTHNELTAAWSAIHAAGDAPRAMALLERLPPDAEYPALEGTLQRLGDRLEASRLAREWVIFFRDNYRQAADLAQSGAS